MKLAYAFLAQSAGRFQDGRLCVWGADVDSVQVSELPVVTPIVVVVKLWLDPDENLEGHTFCIETSSPNGTRNKASDAQPINTIRNKAESTDPSGASLIVNMMWNFEAAGRHLLHLIVDGAELASLPVYVSQHDSPTTEESP